MATLLRSHQSRDSEDGSGLETGSSDKPVGSQVNYQTAKDSKDFRPAISAGNQPFILNLGQGKSGLVFVMSSNENDSVD